MLLVVIIKIIINYLIKILINISSYCRVMSIEDSSAKEDGSTPAKDSQGFTPVKFE